VIGPFSLCAHLSRLSICSMRSSKNFEDSPPEASIYLIFKYYDCHFFKFLMLYLLWFDNFHRCDVHARRAYPSKTINSNTEPSGAKPSFHLRFTALYIPPPPRSFILLPLHSSRAAPEPSSSCAATALVAGEEHRFLRISGIDFLQHLLSLVSYFMSSVLYNSSRFTRIFKPPTSSAVLKPTTKTSD